MREFIGLANYFRFLIPHFATRISPLNTLTTRTCQWKAGVLPKEAAEAFEDVKGALTSAPIVQYPRREGRFTLHTDGSSGSKDRAGGFGATLMQEQDGHDRVIAYASRGLKDHEKNYGACLLYTSPSPRDS